MAVRGNPTHTLTGESTALFASARRHSVKPPEFYDHVESLCPAPRYLDVFSRYQHSERWECYGDEAPLPAEPHDAISPAGGTDDEAPPTAAGPEQQKTPPDLSIPAFLLRHAP
jgi:hypothetical protein